VHLALGIIDEEQTKRLVVVVSSFLAARPHAMRMLTRVRPFD
jgi:hypothetical protein